MTFDYVTIILEKQILIIDMGHKVSTNARRVRDKGLCTQFKQASVLAFLLVFGASYLAGGLSTHGRFAGSRVANSINA